MLPYPSRKKKSKKIFAVATIAAALIFLGSYALLKGSHDEEVVAKVNGQKIFKSEIQLRLSDVFEGQQGSIKTPDLDKLPKEIIEILAKEVYLEKELTKEALKSEAVKTAEVKARINDSKNKILRQAYIDSILKKEITEEKINNKYLELSKELEGKKEYQIFHIVVKTKEEAEKIAKQLKSKKGASKFAELAKKYSIDQETANKGGEVDYTLEDSMVKEIAVVATTLKKDEISDPIQTKFGWHLIKVGDVREAKPLSFEAVKDNIRDQLIQDRVNEINNKIIGGAKIQILISSAEDKKTSPENDKIAAPESEMQDSENPEKSTEETKKTDESKALEESSESEIVIQGNEKEDKADSKKEESKNKTNPNEKQKNNNSKSKR
ncbi:MAG: hypothetical protein EBS06_06900 [Proteobacteria bacterium]|nr:hypothetical protein [Pseudomonadota bacterium]